jgi:hypothetical protein
MSNFSSKHLTLGQVNALVKKLGGHASVLAILSGKKKIEFIERDPESDVLKKNWT